MPLIQVTVPAGSLSAARKQLMVERLSAAAVEAQGLPDTPRAKTPTDHPRAPNPAAAAQSN
jgi:hypothetical protein